MCYRDLVTCVENCAVCVAPICPYGRLVALNFAPFCSKTKFLIMPSVAAKVNRID